MGLLHRKDKTDLVGRVRVAPRHCRPHYWWLYLWRTREAMLRGTGHQNERTVAMHCANVTRLLMDKRGDRYSPLPLVGELHFVAGDWTTEVVFHECLHGALHFYRVQGRGGDFWQLVMDQADDMAHEEAVCYAAGELGDLAYRALWKLDGEAVGE